MPDAVERIDRLYELLPVFHRQRDAAQGSPLRDLLRVIAEQVNAVEDDITTMYDDWFIETCRDWVVPYIADLIGFEMATPGATPRRDVANYLRDLRRRGTLALLESLANDSAGFSSRAVEFFTLLAHTQPLNHLNDRGRFADLRAGEDLDLLDTPFDRLAHTIDVRNVGAARNPGRHNLPNAAAYVWRLRSYPITKAPAYFLQPEGGYFFYTFNAFGIDTPLFTRAEHEPDPTTIAAEINVPAPIRRRALELHPADYYGESKSFAIWLNGSPTPVPMERIISANLEKWTYRPPEHTVVVDPELGRIALASEVESIRVSYRYGFSGDIGAHESARTITEPRGAVIYRVGAAEEHHTIRQALKQWRKEMPPHGVIEICDSDTYTEPVEAEIPEGKTLQLRAANRCRPLLRLLDYHVSRGESLRVIVHDRSRFTLDGLAVAGRPLRIESRGKTPASARVVVRRCTLVPGWEIHPSCEPNRPGESSIDVYNVRGKLIVEKCITGPIAIMDRTTTSEPIDISISDSIVDSTAPTLVAITGPARGYAWASLSIARSTIIGEVVAHAMPLGENSIFDGMVRIVRRQGGCMRFCYVTPDSKTPRRYHCQPDLADAAVHYDKTRVPEERRRVEPRFTSRRFGNPGYGQLALDCAPEITTGADDESEMGAFHDLFLAHRIANLRARIEHSTPAGMESGIIFAD